MVCLRHVSARTLGAALVLTMALTAPAVASAQIVKHWGTLLDVDPDAGTIVLAEIGPWDLEAEGTVITLRTMLVTLDTEFLAGDLAVETIEPWDISPGDIVVVDCLRASGGFVVLRIVVVETARP